MKFTEKWKRFLTLRRSANAGFTLVELIVVIAILAILAGVAVPAYTGYITKANKSNDLTLVSEVANALMLHYYDDMAEKTGGYVVLTLEGEVCRYDEDGFGKAAMDAVFGAGWEDNLSLSYNGWLGMTSDQVFAASYLASSYNGNESALITQLGSVTNMLTDALASSPNLVGSSFTSYLTGIGVDTSDNQAVSNAAILYAADTIGNLDATKTAAVNAAFANFYDPTNNDTYVNVATLTETLKKELGTYGAVAAIYAHGEAFGQYAASNDNTDLLDDFHAIDYSNVTDTDAALEQVANNLFTMVQNAQAEQTIALKYIGDGQYAKDVTAYLEAMKKIDANADKFTDKLGSADCYTDGTAAALLQAAVTAGSLNVSCADGEVLIWISNGKTGDSVSGIQG